MIALHLLLLLMWVQMMSPSSRLAQYARWNKVRQETGYRSQYEADVAAILSASVEGVKYEALRIPYTVNICATYKPDFVLPQQAIMLEVKGEFRKDDRDKMQRIKAQYPHLDIRIMFQNPKAKVAGKLTAAVWADNNGFPWCKGPSLPLEWVQHKPCAKSRKAFDKVCDDALPPSV